VFPHLCFVWFRVVPADGKQQAAGVRAKEGCKKLKQFVFW